MRYVPPPGWPLFAVASCFVLPGIAIALAYYATDRLFRRYPWN